MFLEYEKTVTYTLSNASYDMLSIEVKQMFWKEFSRGLILKSKFGPKKTEVGLKFLLFYVKTIKNINSS